MPTDTPNVGLQVPDYNQANWHLPINYDLNLLDQIFGGQVTIPGLSVTNLVIGNIGAALAAVWVAEIPAGSIPGTSYTLSYTPSVFFGLFVNGGILRQGVSLDYTLSGKNITLNNSTFAGDKIYALYLR